VKLRAPFLFLFLLASGACLADDVGVSEARLFEEDNNTYVLEVDVSPSLISTIQIPILPERCSFIGKPDNVPVGSLLVVRYRFSSGNSPLQAGDELLLYWQRSGIILTSFWLDGSSKRVFLDRELAGFRVPVNLLRETEVSMEMLFRNSATDALDYLKQFWLVLLLLTAAIAARNSLRQILKLLLAFAVGHGIALLATDIGVPNLFSSIVPPMISLAALLIILAGVGAETRYRRFWPVLMVLGLIQGMTYAGPAFEGSVSLTKINLLTSRFYFNLVIDIVLVLCSLALFGMIHLHKNWKLFPWIRRVLIYAGGGLAVASMLFFLPGIFKPAYQDETSQFANLSGNINLKSSSTNPSRPVDMDDPMMGFITITPFEIRCEWLIRAVDFAPETALDESGVEFLPVEKQDSFKLALMKRMASDTKISADGSELQAGKIRADFVSVGSYGVSTRSKPVPEPLARAVVGVSLAYVVMEAPSEVSIKLSSIPEAVSNLPLAFSDPWGSKPHSLSQQNTQAVWQRRLAGFRRPVIQAVRIDPGTWPVVSFGLLVIALIVAIRRRHGLHAHYREPALVILLGAALVLYPFIRVDAPAFISSNIPSEEASSRALNQLLTNIYRAFDYQTEEAMYDQLAVSTMGDQLTAIYLEHQSAMELEDRGGARASVDRVDVIEIREVTSRGEGVMIDASWTVSGSVSHFGHIHYRKNLYNANVFLQTQQGTWKINGIEVKEMERIL